MSLKALVPLRSLHSFEILTTTGFFCCSRSAFWNRCCLVLDMCVCVCGCVCVCVFVQNVNNGCAKWSEQKIAHVSHNFPYSLWTAKGCAEQQVSAWEPPTGCQLRRVCTYRLPLNFQRRSQNCLRQPLMKQCERKAGRTHDLVYNV